MKNSMYLVAVAFLCLVAFPTITVGKNLNLFGLKDPEPIKGWPHPSDTYRNVMLTSTYHKFHYGDSKVWKCTSNNGSGPAISISIPSRSSSSPPSHKIFPPPPTPSHPSPSPKISTPPPIPSPKISPLPPTPSPLPPSPKIFSPSPAPSPLPPTPKIPPSPTLTTTPSSPTPKMSSLPPTPSPLPTLKTYPPLPTPSHATPTPKKSPSPLPPTPSLPPPTPKKSPSSSQPSIPPPEHHHNHHHHHQTPLEHFGTCVRNMGPVGECRGQMAFSFYTRMFQVSDYCCNLVVNMKHECEDAIWGYFTDPYFVSLVRFTCHVFY